MTEFIPTDKQLDLAIELSNSMNATGDSEWIINGVASRSLVSRLESEITELQRRLADTKQFQHEVMEAFADAIGCRDEQSPVEMAKDVVKERDDLRLINSKLSQAMKRIKKVVDSPSIDPVGDERTGLHCGVEDRCIGSTYDAVDYGYAQGVERALEWAASMAEAALDSVEQQDAESESTELVSVLQDVLDTIERPPKKNCSCHIAPPCADCTDNQGSRELFERIEALLKKYC